MTSDEATPVKRSRWPSLASALTSFEDRSMLGAVSMSVVGRRRGRGGGEGGCAGIASSWRQSNPFRSDTPPPQPVFALVRGGLQPSSPPTPSLFVPPLHTTNTRHRPRWPFPTTRSAAASPPHSRPNLLIDHENKLQPSLWKIPGIPCHRQIEHLASKRTS